METSYVIAFCVVVVLITIFVIYWDHRNVTGPTTASGPHIDSKPSYLSNSNNYMMMVYVMGQYTQYLCNSTFISLLNGNSGTPNVANPPDVTSYAEAAIAMFKLIVAPINGWTGTTSLSYYKNNSVVNVTVQIPSSGPLYDMFNGNVNPKNTNIYINGTVIPALKKIKLYVPKSTLTSINNQTWFNQVCTNVAPIPANTMQMTSDVATYAGGICEANATATTTDPTSAAMITAYDAVNNFVNYKDMLKQIQHLISKL